jgi:hypothetical protein
MRGRYQLAVEGRDAPDRTDASPEQYGSDGAFQVSRGEAALPRRADDALFGGEVRGISNFLHDLA